jgi:hypothetical protein
MLGKLPRLACLRTDAVGAGATAAPPKCNVLIRKASEMSRKDCEHDKYNAGRMMSGCTCTEMMRKLRRRRARMHHRVGRRIGGLDLTVDA